MQYMYSRIHAGCMLYISTVFNIVANYITVLVTVIVLATIAVLNNFSTIASQ